MLPPRVTPNRHDRYMGLAMMYTGLSKDPNTQMAAVIVDSHKNRILGLGYNGPPPSIDDNKMNWDRPNKYEYIIHAERNAIKDARNRNVVDFSNAVLYVTGKPCRICMLDIVAEGIKKVVYFEFKTSDGNSMFSTGEVCERTDEIAVTGGVELVKYNGSLNWIRDWISNLEQKNIFI